jgi:uncharacterized membrane protein YoaK (UPF0700 family)
MKIGGYEIPMAATIIPWLLLVLLISVAVVFIRRLWNDKDLNLKKVSTLVVSMGLIFFTVLNMGSVVVWTSGVVGKIIQVVGNVKV